MAKTSKPTSSNPPKAAKKKDDDRPVYKTVADNRRARFDYEIIETYETGISLFGTEVKAIRAGKANLADAHVRIEDHELWLYSCHRSPYDFGNRFNHEPMRKRRLLMHSQQITKLKSQIQEKGLALIPLRLYFKGNLIKVDLAVARGRKHYDKRDVISQKDNKRNLDRLVKQTRYS